MKKILVIGEILVEIMAETRGVGFGDVQALTGPYPSGAPAIFAAQAATLGHPIAIVGSVGDDDFGRVNLARLADYGVDISGVRVDPDRPTGSAFVRYRAGGERDFVFNIRHSAAGLVQKTGVVEALLATADHFHVAGSSLVCPDTLALILAAVRAVQSRGGTVSFDPNLRKEMLADAELAVAMRRILAVTDLYLPSGDELALLTTAESRVTAIRELLERGVKVIVHKDGARGASYHDAGQTIVNRGFLQEAVDPTGAGDCFGATFVTLWLRGCAPERALALACASGALAVQKRGPMEGTADLEALEVLVATGCNST